jgi:hypothetical protein
MSNESQQEYLRHAETCLKVAGTVPDRESRTMLREMAAAWLGLVGPEPRPQVDGLDLSQGS